MPKLQFQAISFAELEGQLRSDQLGDLDVSGTLSLVGTGKLITAGSGQRVELTSLADDRITFYSGSADEDDAGYIQSSVATYGGSDWPQLVLVGPTTTGDLPAKITLRAESYPFPTTMHLYSPKAITLEALADVSAYFGGDWLLADYGGNKLLEFDASDDRFELYRPLSMASGGSIEAEGWTVVGSLGGFWVDYGAGFQGARYRITPDGTVHIQGLIKNGTPPTTLFTLPAGYRPAKQLIFLTFAYGGAVGRLDVKANGDVYLASGSTVYTSLACSFSAG